MKYPTPEIEAAVKNLVELCGGRIDECGSAHRNAVADLTAAVDDLLQKSEDTASEASDRCDDLRDGLEDHIMQELNEARNATVDLIKKGIGYDEHWPSVLEDVVLPPIEAAIENITRLLRDSTP